MCLVGLSGVGGSSLGLAMAECIGGESTGVVGRLRRTETSGGAVERWIDDGTTG